MGVVGEEGFLYGGNTNRSQKDTSWWGDYVFVPLLEKAADAILERQATKVGGVGDRIYTVDMFRHEFGSVIGMDVVLSDVDAIVLLKFLERDRSALVFDKEVRTVLCSCHSAWISFQFKGCQISVGQSVRFSRNQCYRPRYPRAQKCRTKHSCPSWWLTAQNG